jgi:2-methylcitrate dehydratase PrpD
VAEIQERLPEQSLKTGATEALARLAIETETLSIPADVVHAARRAILDTIGVALAGSLEPASEIITNHVRARDSASESVIWGTRNVVSASNAALANGTASHVLDFDDTHELMRGHPSAVVLPAVLAMGERVGASGAEVMAAFVIGVEVACRLGQLAGHEAYDRGWHNTATHGVIGATAAAGRLAGLTTDQMRQAIGLAASHAGGVRQNFGTMTKSFHVGRAAESAITAVELIQSGFTASPEVIEGDAGYLAVLGPSTACSPDELPSAFGNPFALVSPGINVKVYPSCAFTHPAIDLAVDLASDLSAKEIDRVVVDVVYGAPLILIHHRPRDPLSAKFSLEYCVAAALIDHAVTLNHFTPPEVLREDIQAMLRRVEYVVPDEWRVQQGPLKIGQARLALHLADGTVRRGETNSARGSTEQPLSDDALAAKFLSCAEMRLGSSQAVEVHELIRGLDEISSVSELTKRLMPSS